MVGSIMSDIRVVLCTFPDIASARQVGTLLLERQLIACMTVIPGAESIYRWQGKLETSQEVLTLLKTDAAALPAMESALSSLHPYDVPEFIALEPSLVTSSYAQWLTDAVRPADITPAQ